MKVLVRKETHSFCKIYFASRGLSLSLSLFLHICTCTCTCTSANLAACMPRCTRCGTCKHRIHIVVWYIGNPAHICTFCSVVRLLQRRRTIGGPYTGWCAPPKSRWQSKSPLERWKPEKEGRYYLWARIYSTMCLSQLHCTTSRGIHAPMHLVW